MIPQHLHPSAGPAASRAVARFRAWAGHEPRAVACAPGRVNLIGEHTDYNDGFVLPMAIDRWCAAAGKLGAARVLSDDVGQSAGFSPDRPDPSAFPDAPWARYPVGVIWAMRGRIENARPGERAGIELAIASDVPLGSGLSSSASIELATARLVDRLFGLGLSGAALAEIGRIAEHKFAGVPCGIMDQLISACAMPGAAMLIDCRSGQMRPIPLPDAGRCAVVVAHCGAGHALASGEYARRRESCRRAARVLGVGALRDADMAALDTRAGAMQPRDVDCARHVIAENARVPLFAAALESGDLPSAGEFMYESHDSLRTLYRVSCHELDTLVDAARSVTGVFGSRMTGGGFGGCTVTLCRPDAAALLCERLEAVARTVGTPPIRPFIAAPVGGACAWDLGG